MIEGDLYPELRRAQLEPARMRVRRMGKPDWNLSHKEMMEQWRMSEITDELEAVRITLPKEDFEALMEIYTTFYHPANQTPAVQEAWRQYRMLVALTKK